VVFATRAAGPTLAEKLATITAQAPTGLLRERYTREIAKLRSEVERGEKKLANDSFIAKAAPDVVEREREKLAAYGRDLVRVRDELAKLG
jgi:valyl-tRNA synthetase